MTSCFVFLDCLPMYSRNLNQSSKVFGRASVQVPINLYRHNLTIQTGNLWKDCTENTGMYVFYRI